MAISFYSFEMQTMIMDEYDNYVQECEQKGITPEYNSPLEWWENLE